MTSILQTLTLIALGATALMLGIGIVNLFRTTPNSERSNKLMRWRVILQAITLALFAALLFLGKK
jgi:hypothetical protein